MSIYNQSTLGTATNQITFNDVTTFPVFRVVSRRPQQRQLRELDIAIPFENGVSDFLTLLGKTAYVIQGIMYPGGESQYDNGLRQLRKLASLDISQADALSDIGYVPYVFEEYSRNKQIFMKVLYVDLPESTRKGLVQPFTLICKVKDPTIYGATLKQISTSQANFTLATGSATYPFKYPILYGASTSSVSTDANNEGDVPVYPVGINIYGPINAPKWQNVNTGEYIQVNQNLASSSNVLSIAYDKDSLSVLLDGVSVLSSVTTNSTYFKLPPGSNNFSLTGTTIGTGAYATMSYYDGYSLG